MKVAIGYCHYSSLTNLLYLQNYPILQRHQTKVNKKRNQNSSFNKRWSWLEPLTKWSFQRCTTQINYSKSFM